MYHMVIVILYNFDKNTGYRPVGSVGGMGGRRLRWHINSTALSASLISINIDGELPVVGAVTVCCPRSASSFSLWKCSVNKIACWCIIVTLRMCSATIS